MSLPLLMTRGKGVRFHSATGFLREYRVCFPALCFTLGEKFWKKLRKAVDTRGRLFYSRYQQRYEGGVCRELSHLATTPSALQFAQTRPANHHCREASRMISSRYDDGSLRFQNMQDEEVVVYAKCGSQQATEHLLAKYRGMVESKARSYFLMGADHEDVVQEGMIGLFKAIRDFREDKLSKFRPFAELCVTRQIITAVKMATRQKHAPLNAYISLNRPLNDEDNDSTLLEIIPDESVADPATVVVDQRQPRNLLQMLEGHLSNLEARVLECYLEGMSYREMSKVLGCRPKSIDNALQRVKRKVSILFKDEEE